MPRAATALDAIIHVLELESVTQPGADYLPVPSMERAQFLVPADRRLAARTLLAYQGLRPPKVRWARRLVAGGVRTGLLGGSSGLGRDGAAGGLVAELARRLDEPTLHAAIGVGAFHPWWKPVLQLFSSSGSPVGYAKVGWNPMTRALVDAEIDGLRAVEAAQPRSFTAPRLLLACDWGDDLRVSVTAPLPARARALPRRHRPLEPLAEVASLDGELSWVEVTSSPWWRDVVSAADGRTAEVLDLAAAWLGGRSIPFGRWHGDWAPWNMALDDGLLHVWDWEYSAAQVPVGLDLLYHAYVVAKEAGRSIDGSLLEGERLLERFGADLDIAPAVATTLPVLLPIELLAREQRAQQLGLPRRERVDALLQAVRRRLS